MRQEPTATTPLEYPRVAVRVVVGVAFALLCLVDIRGGSQSGNVALLAVAGFGVLVGGAYAVGISWARTAMGLALLVGAGLLGLNGSWGWLTITLLLLVGWWYATPKPRPVDR
jgi:hypothetical protein